MREEKCLHAFHKGLRGHRVGLQQGSKIRAILACANGTVRAITQSGLGSRAACTPKRASSHCMQGAHARACQSNNQPGKDIALQFHPPTLCPSEGATPGSSSSVTRSRQRRCCVTCTAVVRAMRGVVGTRPIAAQRGWQLWHASVNTLCVCAPVGAICCGWALHPPAACLCLLPPPLLLTCIVRRSISFAVLVQVLSSSTGLHRQPDTHSMRAVPMCCSGVGGGTERDVRGGWWL